MALAAIPAKRRRATKPPHRWKTTGPGVAQAPVDLRTLIERLRILCTSPPIRQPFTAIDQQEQSARQPFAEIRANYREVLIRADRRQQQSLRGINPVSFGG
ncbi:hypothetical protein GCM10029963_35380 [Micromonospora andamanensis]|nr:hypothetical protein Vwe01_33860 [Micromonospora andamanensis]